jgi:hypothetical protein
MLELLSISAGDNASESTLLATCEAVSITLFNNNIL